MEWEQWQTLFWGGSRITADGDCSHEIKKTLTPWEKSYEQPRQHIKKHYFVNKAPSSQGYGFPSIRVFSNESVLCIRWSNYWNFSFNISPSNEQSGLISFRMDWLDLFAVQGTLKSFLQHHSSKAPVLQCSAFFILQLSHPYMTTGKTITLTRWIFVGKIMSLFLICCLGWS